MYRFQISAQTQTGESIGIVGSAPELGEWDVTRCVRLRTSGARYPLWWTDQAIAFSSSDHASVEYNVEYKYVRFDADGKVQWESGANRWVPAVPDYQAHRYLPRPVVVDDGAYGYGQPQPFGYIEDSSAKIPLSQSAAGLKVVVIGSSVALGYKAWLLDGWSGLLGQELQQTYGHRLVNVSEAGANISRTIARFPQVVTPEKPDIVIIALSLGNEGLAHCAPADRRVVQRRFESGLLQLIKMTRQLGALPILGGVYPHNDYNSEQYELLKETHQRMLTWDVAVLDWLAALDDGRGRWKPGISFDPAHPNTTGHRLMYEAIAPHLFNRTQTELVAEKQRFLQQELLVYGDDAGFQISACVADKSLRIHNATAHAYTIAPYWQDLQTALQTDAGLIPGIYIAKNAKPGEPSFFAVRPNGSIETPFEVPAECDLQYRAAFNFFSPNRSELLFHDGQLGILKEGNAQIRVINESNHEYNLQPMWKEVRRAFKAMPTGVYADSLEPDAPFRTVMIGEEGLESRVKAPPRSAILFDYQCPLSDLSRVAILPLGDRCAIRMLLYKLEYDGPAFPFDLTRTTRIGDVADMLESRFYDMWSPHMLHYSASEGRIYHRKWSGLSFAHEVEDSDRPERDMTPVYERMRSRYSARSERVWYTIEHSDKILFARTGVADRGGVVDLLAKLEKICQGKPFRLLLISPQSSDEFADLPNVVHHNLEFNPDRMYADLGHWAYCTELMRGILDSLGVSSKNLFWCPPNPPQKPSPVKSS